MSDDDERELDPRIRSYLDKNRSARPPPPFLASSDKGGERKRKEESWVFWGSELIRGCCV